MAIAGLATALIACSSDDDDTSHPSTATSTDDEDVASAFPRAVVDPALGERTIAVDGATEVGARLTARISPDLEGAIVDWGWHRCTDVPSCLTIDGADGPTYELTEDDAWHVLRVIAVARRRDGPDGAVETRTGPVINPDPQPFRIEQRMDPSRGGGLGSIVGPGHTTVTVDAACPVLVFAGVQTPTLEGSTVTGETTAEEREPARHHELVVESDGGRLVVGTSGDCDDATITITGHV